MCREIVHICGPISICSYGVMIFLGLLVYAWLLIRDPQRKMLAAPEQILDAILVGTFAGIIGGRLLFILSHLGEFDTILSYFSIWDGGLSVLGGVISICIILPCYLWYKKIPVLPLFDIACLYAPVLQAISRIGCFFSGCCYGTITEYPWGVLFRESTPEELTGCCLHPTQLYSMGIFISIFLILYGIRRKCVIPGQMVFLYLLLSSLERFTVDFFRGDREFFAENSYLSIHQYIALGIVIFSVVGLSFLSLKHKKNKHESI